jgi:cytochrome P450
VQYLQRIFERREAAGSQRTDLFHVLRRIENVDGTPRYPVDTIAGMFISLMFAGHHTTSTTSSWALLELCRHPERMARVVDELDSIYADGREVRYPALREIPTLERVSKETLRLHPPLIMLMCRVRTSALGRLPLAWPVTVLAAGMLVLFLLDGATKFVGTLY